MSIPHDSAESVQLTYPLPEDMIPQASSLIERDAADSVEPDSVEHGNALGSMYRYGKHAVKSAIIAAELSPMNEAMRYGALASVLVYSRDPLLAAGVLGGTTMALEGAAAVASADYIAQNKVGQVIDAIDNRLENRRWLRRFLSPKHMIGGDNVSVSPTAEAGIALTLGVVAAMEIKQRETPDRDTREARNHGLRTTAWMTGVLAVEGALIAEGVDNIDSPWVWGAGLALLGAAGAKAGFKKVRNAVSANKRAAESVDEARPRYDLSAEELATLENSLVASVKERQSEAGVSPVIIRPDNKFANVVRAYEAQYFPEVTELPAEVEDNTVFLALVDTREGEGRVVHATTISGYEDSASESATGFIVADDLAEMGNFTPEEFRAYYEEKGYDLSKCISVETNFKVGDKAPLVNGLRTVDIAYLAVFKMLMSKEPELGGAAVFSSINRASIVSFGRRGLKCEPLMGRDDLVTSESERGLVYKPVAIPYNEASRHVFEMEYPVDLIKL